MQERGGGVGDEWSTVVVGSRVDELGKSFDSNIEERNKNEQEKENGRK